MQSYRIGVGKLAETWLTLLPPALTWTDAAQEHWTASPHKSILTLSWLPALDQQASGEADSALSQGFRAVMVIPCKESLNRRVPCVCTMPPPVAAVARAQEKARTCAYH
jgi:hypothetical protein